MSDRINDFLDKICASVKYRTMHSEIREEFKNHIDEAVFEFEKFSRGHEAAVNMSLSKLGNATEIGEELNRQYRMPFDNKFGIAIWSGIVTLIVYTAYPLIYKIQNRTINLRGYETAAVIMLIALFGLVNFLYLRRGRLKISLRDWLHIMIGFLSGWLISMVLLLSTSCISKYGYYLYCTDVKIPFAPLYVPFLPKDRLVFGVEFFCWWFCFMVYMIAVKSRRKIKPFSVFTKFSWASEGIFFEEIKELIDGRDKNKQNY